MARWFDIGYVPYIPVGLLDTDCPHYNGGDAIMQLLKDALEFLYELRGAWYWKKDEPRCGYQRDYNELDQVIKKIEAKLTKNGINL